MKRDGPRANSSLALSNLIPSVVQFLYLLLLPRCKVYNYKTDKYLFFIKAAYQFLPRC